MTEEMKRRIGQRICVGFEGTEVTEEIRKLVREWKVGNILLFSRNVVSFAQLQKLCGDLRDLITAETGLPPFIMIDEESGMVSRVGHLAGETPSAGALGATGDTENAKKIGAIIGKRLRAAGVNVNLAPVLDCMSQPRSAVMGNRCYSREPEQVAAFGKAYVEGLHAEGILGCGKHFPGHGDTAVDSHFDLPVIEKSLEALEKADLVPFRAAIEAGLDTIMVAHIVFSALEPEEIPATISSRILRGLLRERMGFRGLAISDGMEMKAMADRFPIPEGILLALKAGIDIALVCHEPEQAAAACRRIAEAIENGEMTPEETEESDRRIRARKEGLFQMAGREEDFLDPADQAACAGLMERAIRREKDPLGGPLPPLSMKTLFYGRPSRRPSPAAEEGRLRAAAWCAEEIGSSLVYEGEGEMPSAEADSAVFFLEKGPALEEDRAAAEKLAAQGVPVTAVALDIPAVTEGLSGSIRRVMAWQYQRIALDALLRCWTSL